MVVVIRETLGRRGLSLGSGGGIPIELRQCQHECRDQQVDSQRASIYLVRYCARRCCGDAQVISWSDCGQQCRKRCRAKWICAMQVQMQMRELDMV